MARVLFPWRSTLTSSTCSKGTRLVEQDGAICNLILSAYDVRSVSDLLGSLAGDEVGDFECRVMLESECASENSYPSVAPTNFTARC